MKVWDRRFNLKDRAIELDIYNASIKIDGFLYSEELDASHAYARALNRAGILSSSDLEAIERGLKKVRQRIEKGENLQRFEDIHSAVEILLTEEIGEAGRRLHTGRSRNEQVTTDERLYLKGSILKIIHLIGDTQKKVLCLAERYPDIHMPGYTHLQPGQVVLFSHYVMSMFWPLERFRGRLEDALRRIDVMTLGSGAMAGSTVDLDIEFLKQELGFGAAAENSMDAVADRSFILETLSILSLLMLDLSRFAEDIIIFSSQEFGFLRLGDTIATSSSLMPQKRNPDFCELVRAASGRMFGLLTSLYISAKGLPSTYNKDLQEDKIPLKEGIHTAEEALVVFGHILAGIRPDRDRMESAVHSFLFATDLTDELVARGLPFREAHGIASEAVCEAERKGVELDELQAEDMEKFHPLLLEIGRGIFNAKVSLRRKKTPMSTHPDCVAAQLRHARSILEG